MANKVEVIYDDKTLETLITVNGKSFDTSINVSSVYVNSTVEDENVFATLVFV